MSELLNKAILYKIYDSAGNFITTWNDVVSEFSVRNDVVSEFSVKLEINTGLSPLVVTLARPETEYGESDDVKQGNRIKVYVFDKDSGASGICVYSGVLVSYTPKVIGGKEYVNVEFFSHYWDLNNKMLLSGAATEIPYNSYDPSDILKDILDKYSGVLDYGAGTIEDTLTIVSYTFNTSTIQEALKKVIELCPDGWYYRVGADDLVYLKSKEANASHYFTIGGNIIEYEPEKRFGNIVNTIYFRGGDTGAGDLYCKFVNSGSLAEYGERAIKMVDERVTVAATAQAMADKILNEKSSPEIRVIIKVMDNNGQAGKLGYDIESIFPGQTCKILNATSKSNNLWDESLWDSDAWDYDISNAAAIQLQIMSIEYHLDYAILELSNRQPDIAKRIEDINRNLIDSQTADNPTTPS